MAANDQPPGAAGAGHDGTTPARATPGAPDLEKFTQWVFICEASDCRYRGSPAVRDALARTVEREGRSHVAVVRTGCLGLCPKRSVSLVVIRQGRSETLLTTPGADPGAVADALFALPPASP